jgi:hypothetical protein
MSPGRRADPRRSEAKGRVMGSDALLASLQERIKALEGRIHDLADVVNTLWLKDQVRQLREKGKLMPGTPRIRRGVDHPLAKLNPELIRQLKERHAAGESLRALAKEAGVDPETLRRAFLGRTWRQAG